jgi:hypothetical protein
VKPDIGAFSHAPRISSEPGKRARRHAGRTTNDGDFESLIPDRHTDTDGDGQQATGTCHEDDGRPQIANFLSEGLIVAFVQLAPN